MMIRREIPGVMRVSGIVLRAGVLVFLLHSGLVLAHTPHDVIQELAVSQQYEDDQTVFVVVRQNLLKSTDGGLGWKRLISGLDNRHRISSLSLSQSVKPILFLSTRGDGIYRSVDGGESWRKANKGLRNLDIVSVSISPTSSDVALAVGAGHRVYGTRDGGETWQELFRGSHAISAVAFSREDPDEIAIGDEQGFLYVTNNAGADWRQAFHADHAGAIRAILISPGFTADRTVLVGTEAEGLLILVDDGAADGTLRHAETRLANRSVMSIVAETGPADEVTLFTATWHEGVFRSKDGGDTWTKVGAGMTKDKQADDVREPHFKDVRVTTGTQGPRTLFVAGFDGLFRSTDGGRTWRHLETLPSNIIVGLAVSPNYANDSAIAVSQYFGGAYLSRDKGAMWSPVNRDLRGRCDPKYFHKLRLFEILFSPNYQADRTIITATWWGLFRTTVGAKRWKTTGILEFSKSNLALPKIAISPAFASDRTIYLGTRHGEILLSTDSGRSFSPLADLGQGISSLMISPNFPMDRQIFAVWRGGILKSSDAGRTWQPADAGMTPDQRTGIKLAISPSYGSDQTLFAGSADGMFVSYNGGASWRKIDGAAFGGSGYVEAVAISPSFGADQTLLINIRGKGLFRSIDGGRGFAPVGEQLLRDNHSLSATNPFSEQNRNIVFSPSYARDGTIFGFARDKVFRSEDRGETWTELAVPLTEYGLASILHCAVSESGKRKYATVLLSGLLAYMLIGYAVFRERTIRGRWPVRLAGGIAVSGVLLFVL